ncbi:MAG: hypothetical protein U0235_28335 [Polyangiaceae bacterium]
MKSTATPLYFPLSNVTKRRDVAIAGALYSVDGEDRTFTTPYDVVRVDNDREVVVVPAAVADAPCFCGSDGVAVWRSFVRDAEFDAADLSTCTAARPWPDRRDGRSIPATNYGAHAHGSYEHVSSQNR